MDKVNPEITKAKPVKKNKAKKKQTSKDQSQEKQNVTKQKVKKLKMNKQDVKQPVKSSLIFDPNDPAGNLSEVKTKKKLKMNKQEVKQPVKSSLIFDPNDPAGNLSKVKTKLQNPVEKSRSEIDLERFALNVHGITVDHDNDHDCSDDSCSGKSELDEEYYKYKPDPILIDPTKVLVIHKVENVPKINSQIPKTLTNNGASTSKKNYNSISGPKFWKNIEKELKENLELHNTQQYSIENPSTSALPTEFNTKNVPYSYSMLNNHHTYAQSLVISPLYGSVDAFNEPVTNQNISKYSSGRGAAYTGGYRKKGISIETIEEGEKGKKQTEDNLNAFLKALEKNSVGPSEPGSIESICESSLQRVKETKCPQMNVTNSSVVTNEPLGSVVSNSVVDNRRPNDDISGENDSFWMRFIRFMCCEFN